MDNTPKTNPPLLTQPDQTGIGNGPPPHDTNTNVALRDFRFHFDHKRAEPYHDSFSKLFRCDRCTQSYDYEHTLRRHKIKTHPQQVPQVKDNDNTPHPMKGQKLAETNKKPKKKQTL